MTFQIFKDTRIGARSINQDRVGYAYTDESAFLVVCDGMGGHFRGEFAAEYVVHYLLKAFKAVANPRLIDSEGFFRKSVLAAHESLITYALQSNLSEIPRTTCIAAIIQDSSVCWANVGDSRLYVARDGAIVARSKDHSHVQNLIDAGKISELEATHHPERNKIYNCIGQPIPPQVDVQRQIPLKRGDDILLSTDGLWGPLPAPLVASVLKMYESETSIRLLMDLSESITGRECDNLSAVTCRWLGQASRPSRSGSDTARSPESRTVDDGDVALATLMINATMKGRRILDTQVTPL